MKVLAVTDREYATILAGLCAVKPYVGKTSCIPASSVLDIATNGGAHPALTVEEIDRLIEKSHRHP